MKFLDSLIALRMNDLKNSPIYTKDSKQVDNQPVKSEKKTAKKMSLSY